MQMTLSLRQIKLLLCVNARYALVHVWDSQGMERDLPQSTVIEIQGNRVERPTETPNQRLGSLAM